MSLDLSSIHPIFYQFWSITVIITVKPFRVVFSQRLINFPKFSDLSKNESRLFNNRSFETKTMDAMGRRTNVKIVTRCKRGACLVPRQWGSLRERSTTCRTTVVNVRAWSFRNRQHVDPRFLRSLLTGLFSSSNVPPPNFFLINVWDFHQYESILNVIFNYLKKEKKWTNGG